MMPYYLETLDLLPLDSFYDCSFRTETFSVQELVYRALYRTLARNGQEVVRYIEFATPLIGGGYTWRVRSGYLRTTSAPWYNFRDRETARKYAAHFAETARKARAESLHESETAFAIATSERLA